MPFIGSFCLKKFTFLISTKVHSTFSYSQMLCGQNVGKRAVIPKFFALSKTAYKLYYMMYLFIYFLNVKMPKVFCEGRV